MMIKLNLLTGVARHRWTHRAGPTLTETRQCGRGRRVPFPEGVMGLRPGKDPGPREPCTEQLVVLDPLAL